MTHARTPVLVRRVAIKNFRSIEACDVALGEVTFLVGANGAGKSNFLDALRLIADALTTSLDHALRARGGIQEVRRRSSGHPTQFGVRVELAVSDTRNAVFAFEVGARPNGGFTVTKEHCTIGADAYEVVEGRVTRATPPVMPPANDDRLYLVNAAGLPAFRPVFDALTGMGFYNINPARIRDLQAPDQGDLLARDGRNLASVTARLDAQTAPRVKERVEEYLARVVPGIVGFERKAIGHMETVEFRQRVEGAIHPWRFPANNMSDGTLRAAAVLVALLQAEVNTAVRLVGIEEPETALHPAAAGLLRDCIFEASRGVQVLVTSHSADLLDADRVPDDAIRAVEMRDGRTLVAPLDVVTREVLRDQLYTAGELLRQNQLGLDESQVPRTRQLDLFAERS